MWSKWHFTCDLGSMEMTRLKCFFSSRLADASFNFRLVDYEYGLEVRSTHSGLCQLRSYPHLIDLEEEEVAMQGVAAKFVKFAKAVEPFDALEDIGINFWFMFDGVGDVRGIYLSSDFLETVGPWHPWVDVALAFAVK